MGCGYIRGGDTREDDMSRRILRAPLKWLDRTRMQSPINDWPLANVRCTCKNGCFCIVVPYLFMLYIHHSGYL
jgi:hypothetical protein